MAFPWLQVAAPLISGFMGQGRLPREQRDLLRIAKGSAQRLQSYGTGVPGSAPDELAALAQQRALLGEDQLRNQQQLYGALSPLQGGVANPNLGDMLQSLMSQNTAQRMAVDSQHLMNAIGNRRQALQQAAGIAQGSAGLAQEQGGGSAFPQLFGQLSQALAYQQARKAAGRQGAGTQGVGQGGGATTLAGVSPGEMFATQGGGFTPMAEGAGAGQWLNQMISGAQKAGGMIAPGNEPGAGLNATANQVRQSNQLGNPLASLNSRVRQFVMPNGVRLNY